MLKDRGTLLTFIIVYQLKCICGLTLPPAFQTCSLSDQNSEECFKKAVEGSIAYLKNGNKQLDIRPIDPLVVERITIEKQPGPLSISQKYKNLKMTGFSDVKISKFMINLDSCSIYMEGRIPAFQLDTTYEFKGQMITFLIDAKGEAVWNEENSAFTFNLTCERYKNNDVEFIRFSTSVYIVKPQSLRFHFGDFIPGNAQVNEELHKMINDDPFTFYEIISPTAHATLSNIFMGIANKMFSKIPVHEIFKD